MEYNITYRKKDKGVQAIISYKKDGKWKQKSKQGFKTQKEAKPWVNSTIDELKDDFEADLSIENKGITFKEFTNKVVKDMEKYREVNTVNQYKKTFKHFTDLDDMAMMDITYLDIQECVDKMLEKNTMKISTIKLYTSRIKGLFDKATKKPYKVISKSPIDEDIELPEDKEESTKIKALTKLELETLLNAIKGEKDYMICLIASTCGLRIGEILGLTWSDIDEKRKILKVYEQWKELKDGRIGFGSVKRQNSNREVPIPDRTFNALMEYKKNNPTDVNNRIILDKSTQNVSSRLNQKIKRCGFNITIHGLRHTYATNLVANGIDFKTIAKLMGHDVEQTLKIYSHVTDDMLQNATNVLNTIFN